MRNYQKLKTLEDYKQLDAPEGVISRPLRNTDIPPQESLYILRMLLRPKYAFDFTIPPELGFLKPQILALGDYDYEHTDIRDSWCYITVRHGPLLSKTDDEFHFDGSSFRVELIPERNYIWVDHSPTEYKMGELDLPADFDPLRHDLSKFAEYQLKDQPTATIDPKQWYLLSPFCFHRRPNLPEGTVRTFYRVSFLDIEVRDVNCTQNPLFKTEAYGRDPVKSFRDNLVDYYTWPRLEYKMRG